jgi:hypothetical protein
MHRTLPAIGSGQISFQTKRLKTSLQTLPKRTSERLGDNLDFEKNKRRTDEKLIQPTLRFFKKIVLRIAPLHLAHAIAAQTQRDTKAIARAKSHHTRSKPTILRILRLSFEFQ